MRFFYRKSDPLDLLLFCSFPRSKMVVLRIGNEMKLVVEVQCARNLMPKDGYGSCSAYVIAEFEGQRKRTSTIHRDLHPCWYESLHFHVSEPSSLSSQTLQLFVCNDNSHGKRSSLLGRVRICGSSFVRDGPETLVYYPLEKQSVFSPVKGELGVKIFFVDEERERIAKSNLRPNRVDLVKNDGDHNKKKEEIAPGDGQKGAEMAVPITGEAEATTTFAVNTDTRAEDCEDDVCYGGMDYRNCSDSFSVGSLHHHHHQHGKVVGYELVEQMPYLFVKVVKGRNFSGFPNAYVVLKIGDLSVRTRTAHGNHSPQWDEVFAIGKDKLRSPRVEIRVWNEKLNDEEKDELVGHVLFDVEEVPKRMPPESPLAPLWYTLHNPHTQNEQMMKLMVGVWMGTQADEAFPYSWQSDTGGFILHTRNRVYSSPNLWYLRVHVIQAQQVYGSTRCLEATVKGLLGLQYFKTKACAARGSNLFWNQSLMFVAAEPFEGHLILMILNRLGPLKEEIIGQVKIPLHLVEKRTDLRPVASKWFDLEIEDGVDNRNHKRNRMEAGKLELKICLEGGYHVLDEPAFFTSDYRPASKSLSRNITPLGTLELGILKANNLGFLNINESYTSAYCVAKYGRRWVKSRTIVNTCSPCWNEQCNFLVNDLCTVVTIAVFHNSQTNDDPQLTYPDIPLGRVRIRLSTLPSNTILKQWHSLLLVGPRPRKTGEILLAVRLKLSQREWGIGIVRHYGQPLWPKMHYIAPIGVTHQDILRESALRMVSMRLSRCEPPLKQEVVHFTVGSDELKWQQKWSMRRCRYNWFRLVSMASSLRCCIMSFHHICLWKRPLQTIFAHFLLLLFVSLPHLILPSLFFVIFVVVALKYKTQQGQAPCFAVGPGDRNWDDVDEELDSFPTRGSDESVRIRYDRLRILGGRVQWGMAQIATVSERLTSLISWQDPRASWMYICTCLVMAVATYMVPLKVMCVAYGFYVLRHPRWRSPRAFPHPLYNFYSRLPSLNDVIL